MAEARDPMTPDEEVRMTSETRYAEPPVGSSARDDAREQNLRDIERDIDHTRAEMSETLDAIGARFQPDYIKEQAKDAIRSSARDAGTTMLDTIKENPIPSLIAGLSIGWLITKGGNADRDRHYRAQYDEDYYRRYGRYPEYSRAFGGRTGYETYRTGYDGGYDGGEDHPMKERMSNAAGQAREKASHLADRATDQVQDIADDARYYGRRAENWLERQMNESPLTMGAVALAAGALVGLAVPETRKEDEWLGRRSDQFKHQARDAAEEKLDQAKRVAEVTLEEAKEKAKDVAETAKDEAKRQHLDEPPQAIRSDGQQSGAGTTAMGTSATGRSSEGSGSTSGGSMRG